MENEKTQYPATAEALVDILKRLRAPGGCPWDREQTRQTLSRHLAEECGELLEAIDSDNPAAICDELGDVIMNVLFQTVVAEERGEFDYSGMMRHIIDKMIRRHAHIFGGAVAETSADVAALWEKIKEKERAGEPRRTSVLDGVSGGLSALTRAEKIQKKAAKIGFDWSSESGILDKITEELEELKAAYATGRNSEIEDELGDLLFAASNLSRYRKQSTGEELLRRATSKFERRFRAVEQLLAEQNIAPETAGIETLEALWQQVKKQEKTR